MPITLCQRHAVSRSRRTSAGLTWRCSRGRRRGCRVIDFAGCAVLPGTSDAAASVAATAAPISTAASIGRSKRFGFTAETPPPEPDSSRLYLARPRAARHHTLGGLVDSTLFRDVRRLNVRTVSETSCDFAPNPARTRLLPSPDAPPRRPPELDRGARHRLFRGADAPLAPLRHDLWPLQGRRRRALGHLRGRRARRVAPERERRRALGP